MSTSTLPTVIPTNVGGIPTQSTAMTSEEIHALLSLPFASGSRSGPQDLSDNLSGLSQSAVLDFHYPARLQPHAQPGWQERDSESPRPGQNKSPEAVVSAADNQAIDTAYDNCPGLPKYADFATIFTREEYMALAICYDIYGLSSSKIVAADYSFETRRAAVLDLYSRFQAYDVFQSMKIILEHEELGNSSELGDLVSLHYSDITWSSSSRYDERSHPISTYLAVRMEQGDLAARLLQANEGSLSRRGKADQGLRKWKYYDHEPCFRKRHGEPSPLKANDYYQDMERRFLGKKGKKSPTSSSSSYETKSGYHSRSSSFSSESHIPGSIRGGEEFPFGYPMPVVNSLDSLLGVHNTPRRKKRTPEEEAPPAPAATMDVDEDIKREKLFRAAQSKAGKSRRSYSSKTRTRPRSL